MTESFGPDAAAAAIETALTDLDLPWQRSAADVWSVSLPGTAKLNTECALELGRHALNGRAFVARRPEENHAAVYRWLLERNLKLAGVAFCLDALGDVYVVGKLPLSAITPDGVDRLLGGLADAADTSFNPILELGFVTSIRREWAWRESRGESLANLAAFRHLVEGGRD